VKMSRRSSAGAVSRSVRFVIGKRLCGSRRGRGVDPILCRGNNAAASLKPQRQTCERMFGARLAPARHHGRNARARNLASTLWSTSSAHATGWRRRSAGSTTTARTIPTEGGRGWSGRGSNCTTSSRSCAGAACSSNELEDWSQRRFSCRRGALALRGRLFGRGAVDSAGVPDAVQRDAQRRRAYAVCASLRVVVHC